MSYTELRIATYSSYICVYVPWMISTTYILYAELQWVK